MPDSVACDHPQMQGCVQLMIKLIIISQRFYQKYRICGGSRVEYPKMSTKMTESLQLPPSDLVVNKTGTH